MTTVTLEFDPWAKYTTLMYEFRFQGVDSVQVHKDVKQIWKKLVNNLEKLVIIKLDPVPPIPAGEHAEWISITKPPKLTDIEFISWFIGLLQGLEGVIIKL